MIRILIVDDHRLFRVSLNKLLAAAPNMSVVGEATDGESALRQARELRPDIVLMDILMPGMGGLEATQRLVRVQPTSKVIAVSSCTEQPFPGQMLKAGAQGYLTKDVGHDELILAIKRVFAHKRYVCTQVAQDLAAQAFDTQKHDPFEHLSNREMQIMMMVVSCQKVVEISNYLHLSPKTVNSYRYRIFDKLKVSSDVELVLLAARHGMLPELQRLPLQAMRKSTSEDTAALSAAPKPASINAS